MAATKTDHGRYHVLVSTSTSDADIAKDISIRLNAEGVNNSYVVRFDIAKKIAIYWK